jgi:hypothetical protein
MKDNSRQGKASAHLADSVHQHLNMYALAATAAGVGILAVAQPAEASIVYRSVNVPIPVNGGLIQMDLNNDGVNDFAFSYFSYQTHGLGDVFLKVQPDQAANEIDDHTSQGHVCAAALFKGVRVGPKSRFHQDPAKGLYMWFKGFGGSQTGNTFFGPWLFLRGQRYLGLKFVVNGETHFGWARLKLGITGTTLTGYAYETVPNMPIITGKTAVPSASDGAELSNGNLGMPAHRRASLGLLAMGSPALSLWRREESANATLLKR